VDNITSTAEGGGAVKNHTLVGTITAQANERPSDAILGLELPKVEGGWGQYQISK
jgi:hypothetical protein